MVTYIVFLHNFGEQIIPFELGKLKLKEHFKSMSFKFAWFSFKLCIKIIVPYAQDFLLIKIFQVLI